MSLAQATRTSLLSLVLVTVFGCEKAKPASKIVSEPTGTEDSGLRKDASQPTDAATISDASVPVDGGLSAQREQWTRCASSDECTTAYDPCSQKLLPVNQSYEELLQAELTKACKREAINAILSVSPRLSCVESRCEISEPAFGELFGAGFGETGASLDEALGAQKDDKAVEGK